MTALDSYSHYSHKLLCAVVYIFAAKRFPEAAQALMRFALACDRMGSKHSQSKAYLGAVVVHLYNQDAENAWHTFQVCMVVTSPTPVPLGFVELDHYNALHCVTFHICLSHAPYVQTPTLTHNRML